MQQDFVAVMPLEKFVIAFGSHKTMAARLRAKALDIVTLWQTTNDAKPPGKRESVDRRYPLFKTPWKDQQQQGGKEEIACQELWLNTHSFTRDYQYASMPPSIKPEHVRVNGALDRV
jgi:hypothetical protein